MKETYPILEFDHNREAILEPSEIINEMDVPKKAVICFFNDVLKRLEKEGVLRPIYDIRSEIGSNPLYVLEHEGEELLVFHPGVGAPLAVGFMEEVIALGARSFIACGGAGVLDKTIQVGHLVVPTSAVRDEGTSYHYIAPSREIKINEYAVSVIEKVLKRQNINYLLGKTWTTDGIYRETKDKVALRKSEGCIMVEMECSAFAALSEFRDVIFGQILYGGDSVDSEGWDERGWNDKTDIREKLFWLTVSVCKEL